MEEIEIKCRTWGQCAMGRKNKTNANMKSQKIKRLHLAYNEKTIAPSSVEKKDKNKNKAPKKEKSVFIC